MNPNWTDLMPLTDSFEGEVVRVELANKNLAIYQINGKVYCTDNQCTHGNALLSDGIIDGYEIECPFHQGRFDIRDGRVMCDPAEKALKSYPILIEEDRIWVDLN